MASTTNPGTTPGAVADRVSQLGQRIRSARTRRKLRREDLAQRAGVSRSTLEAIERGELTTGIGAYVRALWAMGLDQELDLIADPGLDRDGLALELSAVTKRVRVQSKVDNDF
ncbi:helix-turn-helix domain-containing protein [Variovorax ginsengisoli]|uniref:Helix-turn-helix domain-containing protein n=1 Tax=Variovorax ginsengisoli TaxID=363844 RepID=A0ABT8SBD2_9BURK|nr:helix-turn-helix domain-containing protein [Variovorax ginsengisoli]MDN8616424.1 helix-turn-helix domain-containing protein [Variovorax ginsengisoli]MDO1535594.1 helix-turn-helix domain-containing protein [Variovorax ginsengisoli]